MKARCIDASVAVKLVIKGEPHRAAARRLVNDSIRAGVQLIAPPLFHAEVDSVFRGRVHNGKMTAHKAKASLVLLDQFPVQVVTHPQLRKRAREIAEQFDQPAVYDATYAGLAELQGAEFWTADGIFFDAVKAELRFVRFLAHYTEPRGARRKLKVVGKKPTG